MQEPDVFARRSGAFTSYQGVHMNTEQFGQFWEQLKMPLKAKWPTISEEDLTEIKGNLETFRTVLQKRFGELRKEEVSSWVHRRYCHWSGNYVGYKEEAPAV